MADWSDQYPVHQIDAVAHRAAEGDRPQHGGMVEAGIPAMQNNQQQGKAQDTQPVQFDAAGGLENGGIVTRPGNASHQQSPQQPRLQSIGMLDVVVDRHAGGERQPSAIEEKAGIVAGR